MPRDGRNAELGDEQRLMSVVPLQVGEIGSAPCFHVQEIGVVRIDVIGGEESGRHVRRRRDLGRVERNRVVVPRRFRGTPPETGCRTSPSTHLPRRDSTRSHGAADRASASSRTSAGEAFGSASPRSPPRNRTSARPTPPSRSRSRPRSTFRASDVGSACIASYADDGERLPLAPDDQCEERARGVGRVDPRRVSRTGRHDEIAVHRIDRRAPARASNSRDEARVGEVVVLRKLGPDALNQPELPVAPASALCVASAW